MRAFSFSPFRATVLFTIKCSSRETLLQLKLSPWVRNNNNNHDEPLLTLALCNFSTIASTAPFSGRSLIIYIARGIFLAPKKRIKREFMRRY